MAKIVFGGAFDPPHRIHVGMAIAAARQLGADGIVAVPTYDPPHKSPSLFDFGVRAEMVRAAFADCPVPVTVDDIERERGADNYAALVLPQLKQKYGDVVYLIGGDSAQHFGTWYRPEKIAKCCPIAVAARAGYSDADDAVDRLKEKFGAQAVRIEYDGEMISSSGIKARLMMGEDCADVHPDVLRIIDERGVLSRYREMTRKLSQYQSEELFAHSRAVVLTAVALNARHDLRQDFEKVFLAALLHDNAKQRPSADGLDVPEDSIGTPVAHQFLGAEKAKRDFGITDAEVLSAIRYHTTARADMSVLEKLIYTADSVSYDREYPPIPELRAAVFEDMDKGFCAVLRYTAEKIAKKGVSAYPLTAEAAECYLYRQEKK